MEHLNSFLELGDGCLTAENQMPGGGVMEGSEGDVEVTN